MLRPKSGRGGRAPSTGRGCFVQGMVAGVAVVLGAGLTLTASAEECGPPQAGDPIFITEECQDPRFNEPVIDVDEERDTPVPHRYVHGFFAGTDARFSFYFPPPEQYEGRFFQGPTHQFNAIGGENLSPGNIGFAIASGAYAVQTNVGGVEGVTAADDVLNGKDPSISGYRVNAAAAKFSRVVAAELYGDHRPYGYLFGGSGGGYQTIAGAEESIGVWDGVVPFVMGTPQSIPNLGAVRMHALRVLRMRDKFPCILDAIDPGGSGDPFTSCDLNEEEAGALREATRMGFPPRGWWNHATLTIGAFTPVVPYIGLYDPTYFDDYWTLPGYLGHDDPTGSVAAARVQHDATVVNVIIGFPRRFELTSVPTGDLSSGADIVVLSGAAEGERGPLGSVIGNTVSFGFGASPAVVNSIQAGDQVRIDNSNLLAFQTYHRHQVPAPDLYAWDQFRGPDGNPIYPQRDVLVGPIAAFNAAGSVNDGRFNGKMIIVENLMDIDALPWQADWYRARVQVLLGNKVDEHFRVWFQDHAQHGSPSPTNLPARARTVSYEGVLQQALRDLSAWVEKGVKPPASTGYEVVDTQVLVPKTAGQRKGIQLVVQLTANGGERAEVAVGEPVSFKAKINVPPGAGNVVAAEWDFEGVGNYPDAAEIGDIRPAVTLEATYSYSTPGTYFPVLRATSQREGDPETPYGRLQNLGRVRVVVE